MPSSVTSSSSNLSFGLLQNQSMCNITSAFSSVGSLSTWNCTDLSPILPVCSWEGVICSQSAVVSIDIGYHYVQGSLSSTIGNESVLIIITYVVVINTIYSCYQLKIVNMYWYYTAVCGSKHE